MKQAYEKIVRLICGDNWNTEQVSADERDGGYGVAICLACLQKVPCKIGELADAIGCSPYAIETPFKRLQINGVFASNSAILNDQDLLMSKVKTDDDYNRAIRAWCHIAGLASGFVGKASNRIDSVQRKAR